MSWTCAKCGKTFARDNQGHFCERVSQAEFLAPCSAEVQQLYLRLLEHARSQLSVREQFTKKAATWYAPSETVFLVTHPKKKWLDSFYYLPDESPEFPVYKTHWSRNGKRCAHYLRFQDDEDLDESLLRRLKESYAFAMR